MLLMSVMDDPGAAGSKKRRTTNAAAAKCIHVFVLGTMLMAGAAAQAQQPASGSAEFRASVVDLSKSYQRITVPIHRSVTIESTVEATRADVINRGIADVQVVSPRRMLVTGNAFGTTTVVLTGGDKQYVFEVTVELDLTAFQDSIKSIDPQSDAKAVSIRGNVLLVGTVSSATRAQRIVELAELFVPRNAEGAPMTRIQNHLEVAGEQQVLLRCVVAEVSRAATRELGINGFLAGENFKDAFVVNQLGGINPVNIGAAASSLVTENLPFFTDENGLVLTRTPTLSLGFPRVQTQLFLKAMADNQLLSVLAEPNLVAISGETATFLAGGEFPIPVPQGNQQVTIEFREFGVRLNFTPVVRGNQLIRLRVAPEVSELDFTTAVQIEGFVVPGLTSRATETTVELGSGQTIAIAGLLNEQSRGLASRIPGAGDIPVLGALFRSVNYRSALTELIVLVTPEIVAPLDAHQKVRLPGEDIERPNDWELYVKGEVEPAKGKCCDQTPCPHGRRSASIQNSDPNEASLRGPWGHVSDDGAH
jgi:pilus assembly protein CpaC